MTLICFCCYLCFMQIGFAQDRQQNLAHTVLKTIPERYSFSLVWQVKVKGQKNFSALSH